MTASLAAADNSIFCRVSVKKVREDLSVAALSEVFGKLSGVSILGGNESKKTDGRFSIFAGEPKETFEFLAGDTDPFGKLRNVLNKFRLAERANLPEGCFCGGWIGWFGYELGRYIEKLPETTEDDLKMPLIRLSFYDRAICYDHKEDEFLLVAVIFDGDRETAADKFGWCEKLLEESKKVKITETARADVESVDFSKIKCNMQKEYYLKAVEKIRRLIYDGIVYQVNLSQRFECEFGGRALDLFAWQSRHNPSPYAAYIDAGDIQIVSASPEMYITINGRTISTRPIKGTRPRVYDEKLDRKSLADLEKCKKEQAELNMIVDLERNDLARICKAGTRKVVAKRSIEKYPTVFHAVATIAGEMRDDVDMCDVLKGMFPGGSITGAPKVSSMEIIDRMEPTARGVYTGSIGFIGLDSNVCLNIAIRTIIIKGQKAYAQTGGGIVADSDPAAEWHETLTKARAMVAGIMEVCAKRK